VPRAIPPDDEASPPILEAAGPPGEDVPHGMFGLEPVVDEDAAPGGAAATTTTLVGGSIAVDTHAPAASGGAEVPRGLLNAPRAWAD